MRNDSPVAIRDRASRRVRRLTAFAIGGASALTAAFAGIAAGSTHAKSTTKTAPAAASVTVRENTVTAPTPSLTPTGSSATPPQSQPQTQVTPSVQAPVAVSGGS